MFAQSIEEKVDFKSKMRDATTLTVMFGRFMEANLPMRNSGLDPESQVPNRPKTLGSLSW